MRIKITTLLKWNIFLIFILNYNLFYIINIPDWLSPALGSWNKGLVGVFATLLALFCYLVFPPIRRKNYLIMYCIICIFSVTIVGLSTTESTWFYILKDCFQYFLILFTVSVYCYEYSNNAVFSIMDAMNVVSFIWYIIVLIQELVYPITGNYFINAVFLIRNGRLRIDLECFGNFLILYNLYVVLLGNKNNKESIQENESFVPSRKKMNFVNLILGVMELYLFQQTRSFTAIISVGILLVLFCVRGGISKRLRNALLLITILAWAINTGVIDTFLGSISTREYSYRARSYALGYYLSVFKAHPFTGFGFARTLSVVRGSQNMASASDVGFVGQMATMGIFSFIIYIPFVIRMIKVSLLGIRYDKNGGFLLLIFTYYIIATSATLIVLDPPRLLLWPILVAITEREYDIVKDIMDIS